MKRLLLLVVVWFILLSLTTLTAFAEDIEQSVKTKNDDSNIGYVQDDNTIVLFGSLLPDGTYTLRYESNKVALSDYANICTLSISGNTDASYSGLIHENCAPVHADGIGVYNSNSERVGNVSLNTLILSPGQKLYSFAAISDVHIGANTAEEDFKNALTYFENDSEILFTAVAGDLSLSGTDENLTKYKSIVDTYTSKLVYAISGNHEAARGYLTMDGLFKYTGQDLYYSFTMGNDVFIMLGMYDVHAGSAFAEDELQWLYETLEANRNKRCFVFMHLFPGNGSGDAVDMDTEGELLNNDQGNVFFSLLSHYSNVIYLHGHSHQEFAIQEENNMNNYDRILGCHSIHIPSLAYPRKIDSSGLRSDYSGSEGYIIDVYDNQIILRGRDFASGNILPIASFSLDTTIKKVEENTYYDPTGTITNFNSNILKPGSSWYSSATEKSTITKITFSDHYSGPFDESWDASISGSNQVVVYRSGTQLFIVGNQNGIIANNDSRNLFEDFTSLQEISNLEYLNTAYTCMASGMFYNCQTLKTVDLSCLDFSNITGQVPGLTSMFGKCSSLEKVTFPDNVCKDYPSKIYLTLLFQECENLTSIDLSPFSGKTIALRSFACKNRLLKNITFGESIVTDMAYSFDGCLSIEEIDLSALVLLKATKMQNAFRNCSSLASLKLSSAFDPSTTADMTGMFKNCISLTLDCSSWDTSATITDFNLGAPGVIDPAGHVYTHNYKNGICTSCGNRLVPIVIKQPADISANLGELCTLEVTATGDDLTYQWYCRKGSDFFETTANTATYTRVMDKTCMGAEVYCVITNAYGNTVTSNTVRLICTSTWVCGDINSDGEVNNKDASRLLQYLTDWNVNVVDAALDVNGDGTVNNKDATRLFQFLSGWDVKIY